MLVNKLNGGSGSLYVRVRYLRNKSEEMPNNNVINNPGERERVQDDDQLEDARDELLILKTTIVDTANECEIKNILRKTVNIRYRMLNDNQIDLKENFPFFFVKPELVSFNISDIYVNF